MESQETLRQKKINKALQQELASIFQEAIRKEGINNLMVSVTKVQASVDLSMAKVYLSIFPSKQAKPYLEDICKNQPQIRHDLSQRMKNQLRRIPELCFFIDDSLDHIEKIEAALKSSENPILQKENLEKRKKK